MFSPWRPSKWTFGCKSYGARGSLYVQLNSYTPFIFHRYRNPIPFLTILRVPRSNRSVPPLLYLFTNSLTLVCIFPNAPFSLREVRYLLISTFTLENSLCVLNFLQQSFVVKRRLWQTDRILSLRWREDRRPPRVRHTTTTLVRSRGLWATRRGIYVVLLFLDVGPENWEVLNVSMTLKFSLF